MAIVQLTVRGPESFLQKVFQCKARAVANKFLVVRSGSRCGHGQEVGVVMARKWV